MKNTHPGNQKLIEFALPGQNRAEWFLLSYGSISFRNFRPPARPAVVLTGTEGLGSGSIEDCMKAPQALKKAFIEVLDNLNTTATGLNKVLKSLKGRRLGM